MHPTPDPTQPTRFSLVAISDRRGRLLMQERDEHAPVAPLCWSLPGGGREGDESPLANARRELEEETGLTGIELHDLGRHRHFTPGVGWFGFAVFGATADLTDDDVECHEGLQMVFRDVDDLWTLPLTASTARALPDVVRHPAYTRVHGEPVVPERHSFAGVILVDRRGWILLQERDEHPRIDPEKWGLAGGHVEPGEGFVVAAHRELEEETGVRLPPGGLELFGEFVVDHREAYGTWDLMQVFAAGTDLTDADIDCREGRQIVFVDPTTVEDLPLTKAAEVIVPAFLASDVYDSMAP
jgi:8-oxo-dGTP pyrophosphatase MutT (NUDIX family)